MPSMDMAILVQKLDYLSDSLVIYIIIRVLLFSFTSSAKMRSLAFFLFKFYFHIHAAQIIQFQYTYIFRDRNTNGPQMLCTLSQATQLKCLRTATHSTENQVTATKVHENAIRYFKPVIHHTNELIAAVSIMLPHFVCLYVRWWWCSPKQLNESGKEMFMNLLRVSTAQKYLASCYVYNIYWSTVASLLSNRAFYATFINLHSIVTFPRPIFKATPSIRRGNREKKNHNFTIQNDGFRWIYGL